VILEIAYKKHKDWLRICRSFGCQNDDCQDIISEMYIKIDELTKKGKDLKYGDNDINYYYLYKMIFHACLRTKQINKKRKDIIITSDTETFALSEALAQYGIKSTIDDNIIDYKLEEFTDSYENKLVWYDIAIFELISDGRKISELSRDTNISYVSLRNTYIKVKDFIKKEYEKYDWTRGHSRKNN
tara:strand:- start:2565 stop:3122 length:558 start_codon:yes stop_codon:yes gene_type:complete